MATTESTTGDKDGSCLDVIERYSEDLFDFLWCPACGCDKFVHIVFEGVFCDNCNTEAKVAPLQDNRGADERVSVTFSTETTWDLHKDDRQELPDGSVELKITGGPGDREIDMWHPKPGKTWEPYIKNE